MNTAEPPVIQEVEPARPEVGVTGESFPAGRYWIRLIKASGLVILGVTVHLWIDGLQTPVPRTIDVSAGRLPTAHGVHRSKDVASAVRRPFVMEPAAADAAARPGDRVSRSLATYGFRSARLTSTTVDPPAVRVAVADGLSQASSTPDPSLVRTGGLPDLADPAQPLMTPPPRLASWTNDAAPLSSLPVPQLTNARASTDIDAASAPPKAGRIAPPVTRGEEASILQVLHEYETAVGRKDPVAAKAVWPALDDRALARAFNDLQSHSLALEDCGVIVANSNAAASARCQGVATSLPKVGRRKPISASHEWTFNLSKAGGDWQIESAAIR